MTRKPSKPNEFNCAGETAPLLLMAHPVIVGDDREAALADVMQVIAAAN